MEYGSEELEAWMRRAARPRVGGKNRIGRPFHMTYVTVYWNANITERILDTGRAFSTGLGSLLRLLRLLEAAAPTSRLTNAIVRRR